MIGGFLFAYPVLILFGASKDAMLYAYPLYDDLFDRYTTFDDCGGNESVH